jgi:hypothetical protein
MAEEKGINNWDPPPPRILSFAPGTVLALLALIAVALANCPLGAGLAGAATLAGLYAVGRMTSVNLKVDLTRAAALAANAEKGRGGLPPDPPPPRLLKATAAMAASTAFSLSGAIVALSPCCQIAQWILGLSAASGIGALVLSRNKAVVTELDH